MKTAKAGVAPIKAAVNFTPRDKEAQDTCINNVWMRWDKEAGALVETGAKATVIIADPNE